MESLETFKKFMPGSQSPNYVKRYCLQLDEFKWQWFYYQWWPILDKKYQERLQNDLPV